MYIWVLWWISLLLGPQPDKIEGKELINRMGLGVLFHPVPPIQLQVNPWKHVFKIDVPTFKPEVAHESLCSILPEAMRQEEDAVRYRYRKLICSSYGRIENMAGRLVKALLQDIQTTQDAIYVVLKDTIKTYEAKHLHTRTGYPASSSAAVPGKPKARNKRVAGAILAGVAGMFMGTLFSNSANQGVNEKIDNVRDYVNALEKRLEASEKAHFDNFKNMASIMDLTKKGLEASNTRISALETTLPKIIANLNETTRKVARMSEHLQTLDFHFKFHIVHSAYTMMVSDQLPRALGQYLAYLRQFLLSLQSLSTGRLPPGIVNPEHLRLAVDDIRNALLDKLPGYTLGISDIDSLYHVPLESVIIVDNFLYITMAIPIARQASIYDVYRIQPFPRLAGNPQDHRYTLLANLPDYIAITGHYFVELSHTDYAQCIGDVSLRVCFTPFLEHDFEQRTCALSVYLNRPEEVLEMCQINYIVNPKPLDIIVPIGPAQLYVISLASRDTWTFSCVGKRPQIEKACDNCLVTLPCACSFRTAHTYYQGALIGCDEYNSSTIVQHRKYITNLLYLSTLTDSEKYRTALKEALTDDPELAAGPSLELPEYIVPIAAQKAQQEVVLDFSDLMIKLSHQELAFMNETHELSMPELYEGTTFDYTFYIAVASASAGFVLSILVVLLCYKVASLKQSLAVLFSMRSVTARAQETNPHSCESEVPSLYIYVVTTLFLVYIGWKSLQFLYKLSRRGTSTYKTLLGYKQDTLGGKQSDVLLEVGNSVEYAILFLQMVRGSPGQYHLLGPLNREPHTRPSITKVRRCWTEHLAINWKAYILYNLNTGLKTELSPAAKISLFEGNRVGRILRGPMVIRILIGSSGIYEAFLITVPDESPLMASQKGEGDYMEIPIQRSERRHRPTSCPRLYPVLPLTPPCPPPKKDKKRNRRSYSGPMGTGDIELTIPTAPPATESF